MPKKWLIINPIKNETRATPKLITAISKNFFLKENFFAKEIKEKYITLECTK